MTTQAYFEQIEAQILRELDQARESIIVAVAWLTNGPLFNKLCERRAHGVTVELMILDDEINTQSSIDFSRLDAVGGKLYRVGDPGDGTLMHNKFCIIDLRTVINGSYNWSYKARYNHENITVSYDAQSLALQFVNEFQRLKARYFQAEEGSPLDIDIAQVVRRLTLIQNLIQLGDMEDVPLQLAKLRTRANDAELAIILHELQSRRYGAALTNIERYIQRHRQLVSYQDPAIDGLRLEAHALEIQLNALANEQIELERTIHQFQVRHAHELGVLIIELLRLRKERATTPEEQAEAQADESAYQKDHETLQHHVVFALSPEEQLDMRRMYREASKLCHPDAVAPEHQKEATAWFVALRNAYDQNDAKQVKEILDKLEKGIAFGSRADTITEVVRLRKWVEELRRKVETVLQELWSVKNSDTYQTIAAIADMDGYFRTKKEQLSAQLTVIKDGRPAH